MGVLDDIQDWFEAQCNGDWEHTFGIKIENMDDPGWYVEFDLRDTILEDQSFEVLQDGWDSIESQPCAESWIICKVENEKFVGMGDVRRLEQILRVFLQWAKSMPGWLDVPDDATIEARNELRFWEALLGQEKGAELCRYEGCKHKRIRMSVFCARHHFEQIKGKPCPYEY